MPVGYLSMDWNPEYVKTKEKGKEPHFFVYDFGGAGVCFTVDRRAFLITTDDGEGLLTPKQCLELFLDHSRNGGAPEEFYVNLDSETILNIRIDDIVIKDEAARFGLEDSDLDRKSVV